MSSIMREDWIECTFEDLLDYEQPTKYIVRSTKYNDDFKTPVLTAGKSIIKGYTNETDGIFEELPTIIFDDFTTATQFVDFPFKVKSSAMKILVPTSKLVDMKFAYNCIQVNQVRNDTHKRYWISVYAKKKILLPSLVEQNAILSKTEELFSDLDNGIANFKTAQEQLKIYRQAVLKKAFEGGYSLNYDSNDEQENYDLNSENKNEKNHSNQKINSNHSSDNLPKGWKWVKFEDVMEIVSGKNQKQVENPNGKYPIYGSGGIFGKADDYLCDAGTTIIGRKGTIDTPIYVNEKFWNVDTAFGLSPFEILDKKYLFYFCQGFNFKKLDKSTTIPSLAKRDLLKIDMPLPLTIEEQTAIVQEIESRLSVTDNLEFVIRNSIEKAEALRQSILKKAFDGKLLSQAEIEQCKKEADYEPASELLKKIQAEKLAKEQEKKKPTVKKKSKK